MRAVLWRLVVMAAWLGALYGLVAIDEDTATPYVAVGVPLTVAAGALVDRWWSLAVPWVATVVLTMIIYTAWTGCNDDCAHGDERGLGVFLLVLLFAAPATAALAIGIGARAFARAIRRAWRPR